MAKYKVLNKVEVGGETRDIGEILDSKVFAPAPEVTDEQKADGIVSHKDEIESLLSTGHIEKVK